MILGPVNCHVYVCTKIENMVEAYRLSTELLSGKGLTR